jgi:hypothetical protein
MERRRSFRIAVNLRGVCTHRGAKGHATSTPVNIVDLSSTGLRIEHANKHGIDASDYRIEDPISLEFNLKDRTMTHIWKTASIKNISAECIGVEFEVSEQRDPAIGAYILSQQRNPNVAKA